MRIKIDFNYVLNKLIKFKVTIKDDSKLFIIKI